MNKHKKKSWIICALATPLCLMLIVGGMITAVHLKNIYLVTLPVSGIIFATYSMFKITKSENSSDRFDRMIASRKAYCCRRGYLFIEDKKEI